MLTKKRLIVLIAVVVLSFIASLAATLLTGGTSPEEIRQMAAADLQESPLFADSTIRSLEKLSASENQVQELLRLVREQRKGNERKKRFLEREEERIALARESLVKRAQEMEDLRVKLAAAIPALKQAKADLEQERIRVAAEEKQNLQHNALIFEKMKAPAAAETLTRMCADGREKDVILTLRYMSEKAAAKVLNEVQDEGVRARLFAEMKRVSERPSSEAAGTAKEG
jgi:type I site-specific restriction-modification system R (restriction) subunit